MKSYLLLLSLCLLSSCGDSGPIAIEPRPRIVFSRELVQISFPLTEAYASKIHQSIHFENLGTVFLKFDAEKNESVVGAQLYANPAHLNKPWPSDSFKDFPRSERFSKFFRKANLKVWTQTIGDLKVGLLYSTDDQLYAGGYISSEAFRNFGIGAYNQQRFRAPNHETAGMIAVLGPKSSTDPFPGGIFFLSDFGMNPFLDSSSARSQR